MKGKSKIFISVMGIVFVLLIFTVLVLFSFKVGEREADPQTSLEVEITLGEEKKPAYINRIETQLDTMLFDKKIISAPPKMRTDDRALVKISLQLNSSIEMLKLAVVNEALRAGATVKFKDALEVRLSSDNFKIYSRGPAKQTISRYKQTDWKWEIHSKKAGNHKLHFILIAHYEVEGHNAFRTIKVMDKEIEVQD
ncbi:hypothetical protein [Kiloniella sp.]|uniref:hypothetical protein n=1 Tax=Kiloniella sp. TaxID=1938587 RepID=UPI003B0251F9